MVHGGAVGSREPSLQVQSDLAPCCPASGAPLANLPLPPPVLPCRSKGGNNNTYCHDSPLNWLDWAKATADDDGLLRFTRHMIGLRCGTTGVQPSHPA